MIKVWVEDGTKDRPDTVIGTYNDWVEALAGVEGWIDAHFPATGDDDDDIQDWEPIVAKDETTGLTRTFVTMDDGNEWETDEA